MIKTISLCLSAHQLRVQFELIHIRNAESTIYIEGQVGNIGSGSYFSWKNIRNQAHVPIAVSTHKDACLFILDWLKYSWPLGNLLVELDCVVFKTNSTIYEGKMLIDKQVKQHLHRRNRFKACEDYHILTVIDACNEEIPHIPQYIASHQ